MTARICPSVILITNAPRPEAGRLSPASPLHLRFEYRSPPSFLLIRNSDGQNRPSSPPDCEGAPQQNQAAVHPSLARDANGFITNDINRCGTRARMQHLPY